MEEQVTIIEEDQLFQFELLVEKVKERSIIEALSEGASFTFYGITGSNYKQEKGKSMKFKAEVFVTIENKDIPVQTKIIEVSNERTKDLDNDALAAILYDKAMEGIWYKLTEIIDEK